MKPLNKPISNILLLVAVLFTVSIDGCASDTEEVKPKNKAELRVIIDQAIAEHRNEADLNFIDTSLITDMSKLFYEYYYFNGNISNWVYPRAKTLAILCDTQNKCSVNSALHLPIVHYSH